MTGKVTHAGWGGHVAGVRPKASHRFEFGITIAQAQYAVLDLAHQLDSEGLNIPAYFIRIN